MGKAWRWELERCDQLQHLGRVHLVTMRSDSVRAAVAVVAVSILGTAGCLDGRPAAPAGPPAAATPPASLATTNLEKSALDMILRVGSYRENYQTLVRAENELTRRCMNIRGFEYMPHTEPGSSQDGDDSEWRPDLQIRRQIGYGLRPTPPSPQPAAPSPPPSRQAAYSRALLGDPNKHVTLDLPSGQQFTLLATGCIAESRVELFGSVIEAGRIFYLPQDAYVTMHRGIVDDPELRRVTTRWAACMSERGHRFASPGAARSSVAAAYRTAGDSRAMRQLERRIALADGECAFIVRLPDTFDRVGRRLAEQLLPDHQKRDLLTVAERQAAAATKANKLIGHGASVRTASPGLALG
jgi:hypothetical protein